MAACYTTRHLSITPVSICLLVSPLSICLSIYQFKLLFSPAIQSYLLMFILLSWFFCLSLDPTWNRNPGFHPRKLHSTCSQPNSGLNLESHKVLRMSFNHWVIIWTPSKPSCLKTLLLLIMAPVHCWSVTWLFSFCLGNDLAQIPWIVQNQLHGGGWLMMGEPKKVGSFQLSLPWTRAQSSSFAETYLPEEHFP